MVCEVLERETEFVECCFDLADDIGAEEVVERDFVVGFD